MTAKSTWRGHSIIWDDAKEQWFFQDDMSPLPSHGGEIRSCVKCDKLFEGSYEGDPDPFLGNLPGVNNACCGHGDHSEAYIRFTNGVIIRNFTVEK